MAFAQLTSDVEDMVSPSSRGSRRSRGIRAPRGSSAQRLHLLLPRPDPVAAGLQEGRERIENISESRNHRQAGDAEAGCSVHQVTADLDDGPILGQAKLSIQPADTPESLSQRVLRLEHKLYPAVLARFARDDLRPVFITG